eukprot:3299587-Alexandrium_andersonii.AAC.1
MPARSRHQAAMVASQPQPAGAAAAAVAERASSQSAKGFRMAAMTWVGHAASAARPAAPFAEPGGAAGSVLAHDSTLAHAF